MSAVEARTVLQPSGRLTRPGDHNDAPVTLAPAQVRKVAKPCARARALAVKVCTRVPIPTEVHVHVQCSCEKWRLGLTAEIHVHPRVKSLKLKSRHPLREL